MVYQETGGAHSTLSAWTRLWILTLEPARRRNPIIVRNESANEKFSTRRSSCLLLQMFSVETHSFLPNQQSNGCDLARQCETRQRGFHSPGQTSFVEILKRSRCRRGQGSRT